VPVPIQHDYCLNKPGVQTSASQCDVCKAIPGVQTSTTKCTPPPPPCDKGTQQLMDCMQLSKAASNQTQNIANADGTQAAAGDIIKYTLHATNTAKVTVPKFTMQENLSDVLDYAVVKDLDGGAIDDNGLVTWPAKDLAPTTTETHTITVQVKDPIPNTPPDPGDPAHFDHVMTNTYNNTINISLPGTAVTAVVASSTKLVNTGPGTSLAIVGGIVLVAGYFFARSRLLVDEAIIATHQSVNHGGM
jgi:hypothetical protein